MCFPGDTPKCFMNSTSSSHGLLKEVGILNHKWHSSNAFAKISGREPLLSFLFVQTILKKIPLALLAKATKMDFTVSW